MWIYVFALCFALSNALPPVGRVRSQRQSAPEGQPGQVQQIAQNSSPIPIISQNDVVGADGSFNFSYETGNGIKVQESGYVKQDQNVQARSGAEGEEETGAIQVIEGSYSYTAPDGQVISLRYIADENGFQPEGEHLPTPPPIPGFIQKSLQLDSQNAAQEQAAPADAASPAAFTDNNYYQQQQ